MAVEVNADYIHVKMITSLDTSRCSSLKQTMEPCLISTYTTQTQTHIHLSFDQATNLSTDPQIRTCQDCRRRFLQVPDDLPVDQLTASDTAMK